MKKFVLSMLLACAAAVFAVSGCGSHPQFVLPEIVYGGSNGYVITHVTNMERDYEISSDFTLSHSDYVEWGSISYAWIISKGGETVGWITVDGGSWTDNKDASKYSYGISVVNKTSFTNTNVSVYLTGVSADYVGENLTLNANCGSLSRYILNDTDSSEYTVAVYSFDLTGVNPQETEKITVTVNL